VRAVSPSIHGKQASCGNHSQSPFLQAITHHVSHITWQPMADSRSGKKSEKCSFRRGKKGVKSGQAAALHACTVRIQVGPPMEVDYHGYCATAWVRSLSQQPAPLEQGKQKAGRNGPQPKRTPKTFRALRHRSTRVTTDSPHSHRAHTACKSTQYEEGAAKQGLSRGRSSSAQKNSQSSICPHPMHTRRDPAPTPACLLPCAAC